MIGSIGGAVSGASPALFTQPVKAKIALTQNFSIPPEKQVLSADARPPAASAALSAEQALSAPFTSTESSLSRLKWTKAYQENSPSLPDYLQRSIDFLAQADADQDGSLSKAEIEEAAASDAKAAKGTLATIQDLLPVLNQADGNRDGKVTRQELLDLKKALESQRDELAKLMTGKLIMNAIDQARASLRQSEEMREIKKKIKQVNDLLAPDANGKSAFDAFSNLAGDGNSINLASFNQIAANLVGAA